MGFHLLTKPRIIYSLGNVDQQGTQFIHNDFARIVMLGSADYLLMRQVAALRNPWWSISVD